MIVDQATQDKLLGKAKEREQTRDMDKGIQTETKSSKGDVVICLRNYCGFDK